MTDYRAAIQAHYRELRAKKRRIADLVLENPMQVISSSIQTLASVCGCDQTTIVRFAQQLGFSGYTDLKIAIARQTDSVWADFTDGGGENGGGILEKLSQRHIRTIRNTLAALDEEQLRQVGDRLARSGRVFSFGAGSSQLAAMDLHIKLLRLGIQSNCFQDAELTKTFAGYAGKNGMLFLFSHSGETESVVELAKLARRERIPVTAITSFPESTLAGEADHLLTTACRNEPPIRFGVMGVRIAQMAVVDALTLLYSLRDKQRSWEYILKSYHENDDGN